MDRRKARLCLQLHSLPHLSDSALCALLLHYGSPEAVLASPTRDWPALGVSAAARASARSWQQQGGHPAADEDLEARLAALSDLAARVITICDDDYPALLRTIHDPPPLLYLRGDAGLLQRAQLAVVGSRRPSPAGLRAAKGLCTELAEAGLVITSGLALGIDSAAHRATLEAGGSTVAVMATGIDRIYPARHRGLAGEILEQGCLVTEFPPGSPPLRDHFPRRNRVVTGLCLGTLVVEAALPSGSLISAQSALEQGREVFALPWAVYHPGGRGCLHLLRDGANLVLGADDVLAALGPLFRCQRELRGDLAAVPSAPDGLAGDRRRVLERVGYEVVSVDQLAQYCGLPVAAVAAHCSALEVRGLLSRRQGGYIRP